MKYNFNIDVSKVVNGWTLAVSGEDSFDTYIADSVTELRNTFNRLVDDYVERQKSSNS